jgi:DMSO/TMAO reductase YedYZ molybdopterin-dependent catalytic subunit
VEAADRRQREGAPAGRKDDAEETWHAMSRPDLVEKRVAYIERQKKLHAEAVNVDLDHRAPAGTGPRNRDGMPQLPVGQHVVKNWPVLDLGDTPDIALSEWRLEIAGDVHNPVTLAWGDFMALPQADDVSDFHCVTTWSRFNNHWSGVRMRDIAELVVPTDTARFVLFTGYDIYPGTNIPYTTNLPLARATEDDVLLVHTWDGQPLPREHGGPVRVITPKLYAWKGTKWVRRIEFLPRDQRGFWELRGYSNTAEPWLNDRYS